MNSPKTYPHPVDLESLQENRLQAFDVGDGVSVIAIKDESSIRILLNYCPHFGALISDGKYCKKTKTLQCLWHGYLFDSRNGNCVENPNDKIFGSLKSFYKSYDPTKAPKYKLKVMSYEIRDGKAYVLKSGPVGQSADVAPALRVPIS